jgi:hypothetical protein
MSKRLFATQDAWEHHMINEHPDTAEAKAIANPRRMRRVRR